MVSILWKARIVRTLKQIPREMWDTFAVRANPLFRYELLLAVDAVHSLRESIYYLIIEDGDRPISISIWIYRTTQLGELWQQTAHGRVLPHFLQWLENTSYCYLECQIPWSNEPGFAMAAFLTDEEQLELIQFLAKSIEDLARSLGADAVVIPDCHKMHRQILHKLGVRGFRQVSLKFAFYIDLSGYPDAETYLRSTNGNFLRKLWQSRRNALGRGIRSEQGILYKENGEQIYRLCQCFHQKYAKPPIPQEYFCQLVETATPLARYVKFFLDGEVYRLHVYFLNEQTGTAAMTLVGTNRIDLPGVNLFNLACLEALNWLAVNGYKRMLLGPGSRRLKRPFGSKAELTSTFIKVLNPYIRWLLTPAFWAHCRKIQWKRRTE